MVFMKTFLCVVFSSTLFTGCCPIAYQYDPNYRCYYPPRQERVLIEQAAYVPQRPCYEAPRYERIAIQEAEYSQRPRQIDDACFKELLLILFREMQMRQGGNAMKYSEKEDVVLQESKMTAPVINNNFTITLDDIQDAVRDSRSVDNCN